MSGGFDAWMGALDREVELLAGLSVHDLADWNFRDAYEDGESARSVAIEILEANGWDG